MDRIHAAILGDINDGRDIQIPLNRLATVWIADLIRFIGFEAMQREPILIGINRHRPQPQLRGGAEDSNRDLRPIGNKQFLHIIIHKT